MHRLAAVLALVAVAGCATVTRGPRQGYAITSEPAGARVKLSTGETCTTPCNLRLKRKTGFTASVAKRGYATQTFVVTSKLSVGGVGGLAGNAPTLFVGAPLDAMNGSTRTLTPQTIHARLKRGR